jgi:hypothetical protein
MIMRGGGAIGADGLVGAGLCVCATRLGPVGAEGGAAGDTLAGDAGALTLGGTAIAGGAALGAADALGGVAGGVFGGITTTDGGRYVAATDAGVTTLGAGGGAGVSVTGFGGIALGVAGTSALASAGGGATGGFATGRTGGCSATSFCCLIRRSASPGREMWERSILVLKPSSGCAVREVLLELEDASERPRRCLRTRSAS